MKISHTNNFQFNINQSSSSSLIPVNNLRKDVLFNKFSHVLNELAVNSEANARRIQMVESCFGSSGEQLLIPGRVLVGEGVLTKMCRKRPKPRQFFLFNDILVYGNIIIGKKKYNKQHIIPLEEVQLQGLDDTPRELSITFISSTIDRKNYKQKFHQTHATDG